MQNITRQTFNLVWNKDLYELLRRKEQFSEYIEWTYEEHFNNLINEILELKTEVEINWKVKSETMDVVYMVWQLLNKLNKDWLLKSIDFKEHKDKIIWRSPNLKQWRKISREEENKNWDILKSKQK